MRSCSCVWSDLPIPVVGEWSGVKLMHRMVETFPTPAIGGHQVQGIKRNGRKRMQPSFYGNILFLYVEMQSLYFVFRGATHRFKLAKPAQTATDRPSKKIGGQKTLLVTRYANFVPGRPLFHSVVIISTEREARPARTRVQGILRFR